MTCLTHITPTKRTNVVPICQYVHRVKQLNVIASALRFFLIQLNSIFARQTQLIHDNKIGKRWALPTSMTEFKHRKRTEKVLLVGFLNLMDE